jgi:hypothetical protein
VWLRQVTIKSFELRCQDLLAVLVAATTRDVQEGSIDEKIHERLFSDTPVNEGDATLDLESRRI